MTAELEQLDELVARLRRLDAVGVAIAADARPEVEAAARETAAAGTTPDGDAWKATKDGRRALPNVASAITAVVSGVTSAVIVLVLKAPYVFHNNPKGKTLPKRQILPSLKKGEGVPAKIASAIRASASRVIARAVGGRS